MELDAGELTAQSLGALFLFLDLSSALTARLCGEEPFGPEPDAVRQRAIDQLQGTDA